MVPTGMMQFYTHDRNLQEDSRGWAKKALHDHRLRIFTVDAHVRSSLYFVVVVFFLTFSDFGFWTGIADLNLLGIFIVGL